MTIMQQEYEFMFLQVALNVPLYKTFEYSCVNDANLGIKSYEGRRVLVPFGSKEILGIVLSCDTKSTLPSNIKIRSITKWIDSKPLFSQDILKLLKWAASYYHYPIGEVLYGAIPTALRNSEQAIQPIIEGWRKSENGNLDLIRRSPMCKKVYDIIFNLNFISTLSLREQGVSREIINKLSKLNLIEKINLRNYSTPWTQTEWHSYNALTLNPEQEFAFKKICSHLGFGVFLINGVTGSGKTEIYLQLIEKVLKEGKQALVLVPEINLTPQTVKRFYDRFSVPIVCLHSSLNKTEKLESYLSASSGEAAILIGTRSSLFTPMPNLGIIIVDEEHDSSYHQDDGFRYSARDCAVIRAHNLNIPIILGSATPSIESLNNVKLGKYTELVLTNRAGVASMVTMEIVDLCHQQVTSGISMKLMTAISDTISKGNQALIMLNRRGYSQSLICHNCGFVFKCSNCDSNLCLHNNGNYLSCHHCETKYPIPCNCPQCGSTNLVPTGNGTEQISECLKLLFPKANIIRIDRDTTATKGSLEQYLSEINSNKYQILVGTQMLAKGHHFPNVTLVGIVNIDSYLYSNDFRATEKLAQLIIQVSGRAGRENKPGHVILQTHCKKHPLLQELTTYGYKGFSHKCIEERAINQLPPFSYQIAIRADGENREDVIEFLNSIYNFLCTLKTSIPEIGFTAPFSSQIERRQNRFHLQIIVQSAIRNKISLCADKITNNIDSFDKRGKVHSVIEIDPIDII